MHTHFLAEHIEEFVVQNTALILERYFRVQQLPDYFAGFRIDKTFAIDATATISILHSLGIQDIAGQSSIDLIRTLLTQIDGESTLTFGSFRVAEILLSFEGMDRQNNPIYKA